MADSDSPFPPYTPDSDKTHPLTSWLRRALSAYGDKTKDNAERAAIAVMAAGTMGEAVDALNDRLVAKFGVSPGDDEFLRQSRFDASLTGWHHFYGRANAAAEKLAKASAPGDRAADIIAADISAAFRECIQVAPFVESGINARERNLAHAVPPFATWKFFVIPVIAVLSGFALLFGLGFLRTRSIETDVREHARLAVLAVRGSRDQLARATTAIDVARKSQRRDSLQLVRHRAEDALVSAHGLNVTSLDALNRVQQVEHALSSKVASSVTVSVSHGMALVDLVNAANARLFQVSEMDSVSKWLLAAGEYRRELEEQAGVLGTTTALLDTSDVSRSGIVFANAFLGRAPSEFVVRLLYAISFVLIGGGLVFILGRMVGMIDVNSALQAAGEEPAKGGVRAASAVWPLLAPLGLVTGLVGGYALAAPAAHPGGAEQEVASHVLTFAQRDTAGFAAIKATLDEVRDSVRNIGPRTQRTETLTTEIEKKAK